MIDLSGEWEVLPVEGFNPSYSEQQGWVAAQVPGHWQLCEGLERHAGKAVYRKRFKHKKAKGSQYLLRLGGVFYYSRVLLNGADQGSDQGYFTPREYVVTDLLKADNELIVELDCPDEKVKVGKKLITGVFSHWDCLDPLTNPGGIWLPVTIEPFKAARISELMLATRNFDEQQATIEVSARIDALEPGAAKLALDFAPENFKGEAQRFEFDVALHQGENVVRQTVQLAPYKLWWPHDVGEPNLYSAKLKLSRGRTKCDERSTLFGVRTFEMNDLIAYINGHRYFLRGNNYPPSDTRLATTTAERVQTDMELAKRANLNLLRVHAHIDHPLLYDAADRAGILLWQDFPLQWLYDKSIMPECLRQSEQMVRLLYNHPSIVIWCCHNEPVHIVDTKDEDTWSKLRLSFSATVYSWNRDVMDSAMADKLRRIDPTRETFRSSGDLDLLKRGGDTHFYFGWYRAMGKSMWTFDKVRKYAPRNLRLISEFGAQSLPNRESALKFIAPDGDASKIDWDHLELRHSAQPELLRHWLGDAPFADLDRLIEASQDYQSKLNRFYIDRIRLAKYEPAGGLVPFMFSDPNPAILWSIVDYWRVPKGSFEPFARAMSPQYAFTVFERPAFNRGQIAPLPVYAVNDKFEPMVGEVDVRFSDPAGNELWSQTLKVDLPADSKAVRLALFDGKVERIGDYKFEIVLRIGDSKLVNNYDLTVV
ncbi:MAG: glycoside hydrolase family 2 TIM barrel-domain containing protein [Candidatus Alcyoniella australis]|nr:glycoside hydrolase family 2 TIM barrel-domain containing protein [Candidatus Alcyoniella australis]